MPPSYALAFSWDTKGNLVVSGQTYGRESTYSRSTFQHFVGTVSSQNLWSEREEIEVKCAKFCHVKPAGASISEHLSGLTSHILSYPL